MPGVSATPADVLGALAIISAAAAVAFGPGVLARIGPHPSAAECEALVERYAELKERAVTEKIEPARREAAIEEAKRAAGPRFSACTAELTREELECARTAHHADEVERCLR